MDELGVGERPLPFLVELGRVAVGHVDGARAGARLHAPAVQLALDLLRVLQHQKRALLWICVCCSTF